MLTTRHPKALTALSDSILTEGLGAWSAISASTLTYWFGALNRCATPFDLAQDLTTWGVTMADRKRPEWAHESITVREWPLGRLRDYSTPDADPGIVPTIILPPQAGHDSSIVDFAADQSQVKVGRDSGCHRIYALEWIGATPETKDATIEEYIAMVREAVELLGGQVNLVGDCQGGWFGTIFAALHPELVNSLAIAGAPIDFHAGDGPMRDWLDVLAPDADMTYFRAAVDANDGMLPGRFLLDGFKALQPFNEITQSLDLLANLRNPQHLERYRKFEDWFQWTQPLPGTFYLWIVENLFLRNSLIKGEVVIGGRTVDLAQISCPIFLLAGRTDHITPPDQVWALADHVSTPPEQIERQLADSGHLGLFMSRAALAEHWPAIFEGIAELSGPSAKPVPSAKSDSADKPMTQGELEVTTTVLDTKPAPAQSPAKKAPARKASARKASARKAPAAKTPAAKASTSEAEVPAEKTPAAKAPAAKAPAAKAPASKAPASKSSDTKAPGRPASTAATAAEKSKSSSASKSATASKTSTTKASGSQAPASKTSTASKASTAVTDDQPTAEA